MVFKKGVKSCFGLLPVFFIIFGLSLSVSLDASAFDFGNVNSVSVSGGWVNAYKGSSVGDTYERQQYVLNINAYKILASDSSLSYANNIYVNRINIDLGNYSIPAYSLFNFTVRYDTHSTVNGLSVSAEDGGGRWVLLNKTCQVVHEIYGAGTGTFATNDMLCTYWGYNSSAISNFLTMNTRVYYPTDADGNLWIPAQIMSVRIYDSAGGGGSGGLSPSDREFLQQQIGLITSSMSTNSSLLTQLKTLIENQGEDQQETLDNIQEAIESQNEREEEAIDNISNQSPSDIEDATDSSTTSIIGAISSFLTALQGFTPSSCELTLPFPQNIGGNKVVNPCSGKEKAPTIVQVGSSLLLITTFVPLAFIVLRMIYNEIRSWTSG